MLKDKSKINSDLTKLIKQYKKCIGKYEKMFKLTKLQQEIITKKKYTELKKIVNKKQNIINETDELQTRINILRKQLSDNLDIINDEKFIENLLQKNVPYKNKLKKIKEYITRLITKIKKIDEENEKKLNNRKEELKEELSQLINGKKIFDSYNTKSNNQEGKFFDNKG